MNTELTCKNINSAKIRDVHISYKDNAGIYSIKLSKFFKNNNSEMNVCDKEYAMNSLQKLQEYMSIAHNSFYQCIEEHCELNDSYSHAWDTICETYCLDM